MSTNIMLLPEITFSTVAPANVDMFDPIATLELNGQPIDLTGIAFRAMARSRPLSAADLANGGAGAIILDAQSSNWTSSDVTAPNGWLVSGGASGTLSWAIPQSKIGLIAQSFLGTALAIDIVARADGRLLSVGSSASVFVVAPAITYWPGMN